MKRAVLSICILVSLLNNSFGQKDWSPEFNGYVVRQDKSVEKGYLKFNGSTKTDGMKIELYKSPNGRPMIFYSFDLDGYVYEKDTFKILANLDLFEDKDKQFDYLEVKIETTGKLTLYSFDINSYGPYVSHGTMAPAGFGTVGGHFQTITEKYYIIESKDGIMTGIMKKNYKEVLSELLVNDYSLSERLKKGKVKYKDLKKIVKEYNMKFG